LDGIECTSETRNNRGKAIVSNGKTKFNAMESGMGGYETKKKY
jgi:hypothetical protein